MHSESELPLQRGSCNLFLHLTMATGNLGTCNLQLATGSQKSSNMLPNWQFRWAWAANCCCCCRCRCCSCICSCCCCCRSCRCQLSVFLSVFTFLWLRSPQKPAWFMQIAMNFHGLARVQVPSGRLISIALSLQRFHIRELSISLPYVARLLWCRQTDPRPGFRFSPVQKPAFRINGLPFRFYV